ncbi:MAG: response regulator transcription factor [Peptococcaceae bacterium]|jgi:DNA-binding response OmpR family regulator|nr:response regulator transcription factor [Peptococcaceae bacterium]
MEEKRILVVDDDVNICRLIKMYLMNEGFQVLLAHDGQTGLDMVAQNQIDLVILDIMLPVMDGWEVCKTIRKVSQVPIIMLTARDMLDDKLQGFEFGADDYMSKPFETKELVARVKARLKEKPPEDDSGAPPVLSEGNLTVDLGRYQVKRGKDIIDLKPKEIQLLHFLLKNKNLVFSREQLLEKVWGYTYYGDTRTVDVHVKRLREKLDAEGNDWQIKTIWGVGYKLEVDE